MVPSKTVSQIVFSLEAFKVGWLSTMCNFQRAITQKVGLRIMQFFQECKTSIYTTGICQDIDREQSFSFRMFYQIRQKKCRKLPKMLLKLNTSAELAEIFRTDSWHVYLCHEQCILHNAYFMCSKSIKVCCVLEK